MTEGENKQIPLIPEVRKSIDDFQERGMGVRTEAEVFRVPEIVMDEAARRVLKNWPLEISSRRIINNKPFAMFAELPPKVLYDFKEVEVEKVEFKMVAKDSVEMKLTLKGGKVLTEQLILESNGKVEHIWGVKIEEPEK